jgi:hypothetical protein
LNHLPRWDPLVEDCWYSNDDPKQRLAWQVNILPRIRNFLLTALRQIGTQLFWTLLTVAGEIICTATVVIYMVRHQVRSTFVHNAKKTLNIYPRRSGRIVFWLVLAHKMALPLERAPALGRWSPPPTSKLLMPMRTEESSSASVRFILTN